MSLLGPACCLDAVGIMNMVVETTIVNLPGC
jgi:hypothetical protein